MLTDVKASQKVNGTGALTIVDRLYRFSRDIDRSMRRQVTMLAGEQYQSADKSLSIDFIDFMKNQTLGI